MSFAGETVKDATKSPDDISSRDRKQQGGEQK